MRVCVVASLLAAACAPPPDPALDGGAIAPTIRITYPEDGAVVPLDANCDLEVLVTIDVDGIEVVPASDTPVDGEGHWHVQLEPHAFIRILDGVQFAKVLDEEGFPVDSLVPVSVSLQANDHADLGPRDTIEIVVADNPDVACP